MAALQSELAEQKAIVRALGRGKAPPEPGANGSAQQHQPAPKKKSPARRQPRATDTRRVRRDQSPTSLVGKDNALRGSLFSERPEHVDDLKKITGIGPVTEIRLNEYGIYQFGQVMGLTSAAVKQLDAELSLGGRIAREEWIKQARKLAK